MKDILPITPSIHMSMWYPFGSLLPYNKVAHPNILNMGKVAQPNIIIITKGDNERMNSIIQDSILAAILYFGVTMVTGMMLMYNKYLQSFLQWMLSH